MTYSLLSPPRPIACLGCWAAELPLFSHVIGYSGIGHFFLLSDSKNDYAVLHPYRRSYKSYGSFSSIEEFERVVLANQGFAEYVLKPQHQASIEQHLGALQPEEVYIARPYPFLGGSEAPDSYMRGNVWVFAELVGRSHGIAAA